VTETEIARDLGTLHALTDGAVYFPISFVFFRCLLP
jgi:hypothetical protein